MMAVEVMHLLVVKWHSLCGQAGLKTLCERGGLTPSQHLGLGAGSCTAPSV